MSNNNDDVYNWYCPKCQSFVIPENISDTDNAHIACGTKCEIVKDTGNATT